MWELTNIVKSVGSWGYGWIYVIVSRIVIALLWLKHYGKVWYNRHQIEHKEGDKFNIKIIDVKLSIGGAVVKSWKREGESFDIIRMMENGHGILWSELLENIEGVWRENEETCDKVLMVDYKIDDSKFKIFYNWENRWEYPISFPPYSDEELEREWKKRDYKHSILVAELDGIDITESVNQLLGPKCDMCADVACAVKVNWLHLLGNSNSNGVSSKLTIIDNNGNDFNFEGEEVIVL